MSGWYSATPREHCTQGGIAIQARNVLFLFFFFVFFPFFFSFAFCARKVTSDLESAVREGVVLSTSQVHCQTLAREPEKEHAVAEWVA
jgi:hypothetical protein